MHYANGQEAKAGDLVIRTRKPEEKQGQEFIGVLVSGTTSSNSCNGQVKPVVMRNHSDAGTGPWLPTNHPYDVCVSISDLLPLL